MNSQQPQRVVIQYTRPVTSPHPNFGCFIYVWNCVFQFLNISCAICCIVVGAFLCAAVWYVGVPLIFAGLLLLSVSCWICYYVITGRNVQGRTESQVFYVTGVPSAPAMPYTSQTEFIKNQPRRRALLVMHQQPQVNCSRNNAYKFRTTRNRPRRDRVL